MVAALAVFLGAGAAFGEEPAARQVRVSFVPPPIEGTISLGIYDSAGKLVRVLHREADVDAFEIGADALNSTWDGKNDAGEALPAAQYSARGYAVGDLQVDGVGFFFNDWVTDEQAPRIRRMENLALHGEGSLLLLVTLADGSTAPLALNEQGELSTDAAPAGFDFYDFVSPERRNLRVRDGVLSLHVLTDEKPVTWPQLNAPRDAAYGADDTVWVIDEADTADGALEVKQFSASGEFLRRLSIPPDEPQPRVIVASRSQDRIYLLEEKPGVQRLRALTLQETKGEADQPVSDWQVGFEKTITAHENFTLTNGAPVVRSEGAQPLPPAITVKLQPNALEGGKRKKIELAVGLDAQSSYLRTADGLPLHTISETPHLKQVLLTADGEKAAHVFQSDGAVVEQFRVTNLDQMVAFDCGAFALK
ncbi:MAG: hypothetical protein H0V56_06665 [Chthoniobacterales bacterium]|nr:hypothetical protein [Chthoniobacterales bacterium]